MPSEHLDPPKLIFNCEPASSDDVTSMDLHERDRIAESSNIDPGRTPLNRILLGDPAGPNAALKAFYKQGVTPPSRRARKPYLRIVLGASNSHFRPEDPKAIGTWNDQRLRLWVDAAMPALKAEFGEDLVHVSLHLDEDTPHIHALVAPTYLRAPRRIDRKRKGETEEDFVRRKRETEAATGVRTVGRASHPVFKLEGSFEKLRAALARHFTPLGIHPGDPRTDDDPKPKTTRKWVNEETDRLRQRQADMVEREACLEAREADLASMRTELDARRSRLDADFAEFAELKEAAVREAHAHYQDELLSIQRQVNQLLTAVRKWVRPLRALRNEAAADLDLVARIKKAFQDPSLKKFAEVRAALDRATKQDYRSGQLGAMQRSQDAERLAPLRRSTAQGGMSQSKGTANPDGMPSTDAQPKPDPGPGDIAF